MSQTGRSDRNRGASARNSRVGQGPRSAQRSSQGGGRAGRGRPGPRPSPPSGPQPAPQVAGQSSLRDSIDRILPPFSFRRYAVIWVLMMVPLLLVLLLLLRPGLTGVNQQSAARSARSDQTSGPSQSNTGQPGSSNAQTPAPVQNPLVSSPTAPAYASTAGTQATRKDKYLVIETARGRIVAKLYTDPSAGVGNTIANFEQKANSGYFDGLIFHRVENWVIQGGDPTGTGTGGGRMPAEYNQIPFKAGALGVARGADPTQNSDSQFFIVKTDAGWLDGQYTNWGQVVEGMDVVNQIAVGDKMLKVTVETR